MDKVKTKILFAILIVVMLFSVQAISAVNNDDINSTSDNIDLSIYDYESNVNQGLRATNTDDVLEADEHPFSELQGLIDATGDGGTLELDNDYILTESSGTLAITKEITIDGKGHTLNANHLNAILYSTSTMKLRVSMYMFLILAHSALMFNIVLSFDLLPKNKSKLNSLMIASLTRFT